MIARTRTFEVFEGSTCTIAYYVVDAEGNALDAESASGKLYDSNMSVLATLDLLEDTTGVFKTTIDTTSLGLNEGKYIIEFTCLANGNSYARRDYLNVRKFL